MYVFSIINMQEAGLIVTINALWFLPVNQVKVFQSLCLPDCGPV
jgi:hypothetical protein